MPDQVLPDTTTQDLGAPLGLEQVKTRIPDETNDLQVILKGELAPSTSLLGRFNPDPEQETKYEVHAEVGRGGMGKILEVRDNDLNRKVAMKVLLREEDKQPNLRRFIEEAQITGQLEHPNVLPVHDLGVNEAGDLFFTMKYVAGHETLRQIMDRLIAGDAEYHDRYTFERRAQIVQQVCHVLHYAHRRGVIHRDIKPDNIILGHYGEVFLVDWGVAKIVEVGEKTPPAELGPKDGPVETISTLEEFHATQEGAWVGTPAYMSPEQIVGRNKEVRAHADLYALCAVLYEFLCLQHYLGDTRQVSVGSLVALVISKKPLDAESFLHKQNGRVPRHLSRICRKGLSKRSRDRWQSALELELALQHWLEGRAPIVCPGTFIQHTLSRWSTVIDRYPVAGPFLTISGAVILVLGLLAAVVQLVISIV